MFKDLEDPQLIAMLLSLADVTIRTHEKTISLVMKALGGRVN